jgi:lipopolysaccharide export system permease protein
MYSMRQLDKAIDSLTIYNNQIGDRVRGSVFNSFHFTTILDSTWKADSTLASAKSFDQLIPDSIESSLRQSALIKISNARPSNQMMIEHQAADAKTLRQHKIEWHRKIALSMACLVLFLIGAPLGSIIRKGGLGSPLIFSIVFFMLFYFSNTTGEKSAKEGSMTPFTGMWLATFLLLPIGLFLTYKAMRDSQLFNKEAYQRFFRKIRRGRGEKKVILEKNS